MLRQGLGGIGGLGAAVGHIAEGAAAGADLAQDHERGGAVAETLVDVGAAGFFAHGDQVVLAEFFLEFLDGIAGRDSDADPARFAQGLDVLELHGAAGDLVACQLFIAWRQVQRDDFARFGGGHFFGLTLGGRWLRLLWQYVGQLQVQPEQSGHMLKQSGFDAFDARGTSQV